MERYTDAVKSGTLAVISAGSVTTAWRAVEPLVQAFALLVSIAAGVLAIVVAMQTMRLRWLEIRSKFLQVQGQEDEYNSRPHRLTPPTPIHAHRPAPAAESPTPVKEHNPGDHQHD
ncbi:MAG: hypothetical protein ACYDC1_06295 [Limisphaerales bacterium]